MCKINEYPNCWGNKRAFSIRYGTTQSGEAESSSPPQLFDAEVHSGSPLQQRHQGRENQGKRAEIFSKGPPLPILHPLPTAVSHGTGAKGSWGHAVGLSCSSRFPRLSPYHGSSASRGGGRARSITVINKTSLFLTCKIDHSSRNLSLPS